MKPHWLILLIIFAIFSLAWNQLSPNRAFTEQLQILVDPRVELMAIAIYMSDPQSEWWSTKLDFAYKREVEAHFITYKRSAVQFTKKLSDANLLNFVDPFSFILHHGPPPQLNLLVPYTSELLETITLHAFGQNEAAESRREVLQELQKELKKFAEESGFSSFFDKHQQTYRAITTQIRQTLRDRDYVKILEDYFGSRLRSYTLIPVPLLNVWAVGLQVAHRNGIHAYSIIGPVGITEGALPFFGDEKRLSELIYHEFGHSFVNPITDRYRQEVDRFAKSLFPMIQSQMTAQYYPEWQLAVNEHILHAIVGRVFAHQYSESEAEAFLQQQEARGFLYVQSIYELLQEYEQQRDRYPDFASFYPRILELFAHLERGVNSR